MNTQTPYHIPFMRFFYEYVAFIQAQLLASAQQSQHKFH